MTMKRGGVTYPEGFLAAGVSCGIKGRGRKDLALLFSPAACVAAGCFTTNQCKSYSLLLTRRRIGDDIRAVLMNSGNANACNGRENWTRTLRMTERLGEILKVAPSTVLMASTGIIGKPLPDEKIGAALKKLAGSLGVGNHGKAAAAIMTTDTRPKEAQTSTGIAGRKKEVVIGGMAKGAGMINPTMATMLAFITTDAVIAREALQAALISAVEESFNMITVDDDQSTNDMVLCLASGLAGNRRIRQETDDYVAFAAALKAVCTELAKAIAHDGEGAEKAVEVRVRGGWCRKDVRRVAKRIAGSNLVKSAIAGGWPNWGRILSSVGTTNARVDLDRIEIAMCGMPVYRGEPVPFDDEGLKKALSGRSILIEIDLKRGSWEAVAWGCDLTEAYVTINREE